MNGMQMIVGGVLCTASMTACGPYYEDDEHAGDIKGQGKNEFGGLWYLVSPNGDAIPAGAERSSAAR